MSVRVRRAAVVLAACGLLAGGCADGPPPTGDVTGRVVFDGRPLPGGQVVFTNEADTLMATADLNQDGRFEVKGAPAGPVVFVHVKTEALRGGLDERTARMLQAKGVPAPVPDPKVKGNKYVRIPPRYADRTQSGLRYEVKPAAANEIEVVLTR